MAGLPFFLIGLNFLALAYLAGSINPVFMTICVSLGLAIMWMALRIRGGAEMLVPVACVSFLIAALWSAPFVPAGQWVIYLLAACFSLNGLRGWLWLRRN